MEEKIKELNYLGQILQEINDQISKERGIYLLNSMEALYYISDAINAYIPILSDAIETIGEENENIADNILDLFDKMEELKND